MSSRTKANPRPRVANVSVESAKRSGRSTWKELREERDELIEGFNEANADLETAERQVADLEERLANSKQVGSELREKASHLLADHKLLQDRYDDQSKALLATNERVAALSKEAEDARRKLVSERADHMATINERDAARERAGLAEQRVVYLEETLAGAREGLNQNPVVQAARAVDVALASRAAPAATTDSWSSAMKSVSAITHLGAIAAAMYGDKKAEG